MLHFFRKHQKIFFLFTTVIIVISFSFFGTYQAFSPMFKKGEKDEVLFSTSDGRRIHSSYLKAMGRFLNTENWMMAHRPWSVNFLNDGVISKEFLDSGFALSLHSLLSPSYFEELEKRHTKEKEYMPYAHPKTSSLSASNVWALFAPEIPDKLKAWKEKEKPEFEEKMSLFLAEKAFPPSYLAQAIRYQQMNFGNHSDPRLNKDSFNLFGYHTLEDWFGLEFIDLTSKIIIKGAALAREKGYKVSKDEAFQELLATSQRTLEVVGDRMELPIHDANTLLSIYLRQNGFDEAVVISIWQDVLLFRKYMQEVASAALVDFLPLESFYGFAHENVLLELHQLPQEFRFRSYQDLKDFETYSAALFGEKEELSLSPKCNSSSCLGIPLSCSPTAEIEKRAPELVGKKYRVYFGATDITSLSGKVSVKETWEWERENWDRLKEEFSELKQKSGEAVDILEAVDLKTRKRIDTFARKQIAISHPNWVEDALKQQILEEKEFFLTTVAKLPFDGITDPIAFGKLLDEETEVLGYTQDKEHFFRILVQEKALEKDILTFKEAKKQGALEKVAERLKTDTLTKEVIQALVSRHKITEEQAPFYRFVGCLEDKNETALSTQMQEEKIEKTITRSDPSFFSFEDVLALPIGVRSPSLANQEGGAYYYFVLDKKKDTSLPLEKMARQQEMLAKEVKKQFFNQFLKQIKSV